MSTEKPEPLSFSDYKEILATEVLEKHLLRKDLQTCIQQIAQLNLKLEEAGNLIKAKDEMIKGLQDQVSQMFIKPPEGEDSQEFPQESKKP